MQQVRCHLAIGCRFVLKLHQKVLELLHLQNHLQTDQKYWCCHLKYVVLHFADQTALCFQHCLVHKDYWLLIFFLLRIYGTRRMLLLLPEESRSSPEFRLFLPLAEFVLHLQLYHLLKH